MTISATDLRRALGQLASLGEGAPSLEEALSRIADAAATLFAVDGASLMLIDRDHLLRDAAASDPRAHALEALHLEHDEGPCLDAYEGKELVDTGDLGRERRWPRFGPAAVRQGLQAVLASPIPYDDQAVGVVAVFSVRPHHWRPDEQEAIVAFTDLAALVLVNAMQAEQRGRLAGELQVALDSRVIVEQAKGVLVGRHGLSPRQAFERLRRQARDERRPLAEVAGGVVAAAQQP